jgi:sulfide dehydrogenase cytochrome subunit
MKLFAPVATSCACWRLPVQRAGRRSQSGPQPGRYLRQLSRHQRQCRQGLGMDALAGMEKAKILQKLADYKSGDKPAIDHASDRKGYTEAQLDLIAAYFAAQK